MSNKTIALGVERTVADSATEVQESSTIKAVYIELWITGDDAVQGSGVVTVEKRPSGHAAPSAAEMASLDSYDNKKNILISHMGLFPPNTQNPVNIFREWIAIPKGKQSFGLADLLSLNILAQSDGVQFCGLAIYKEYY